MEKGTIELFLNYGVLGVIGWSFLSYVKKMLDQTLENQKSFQNDITQTMLILRNHLVNGYLTTENLLDIAKSKYSHSLYKYRNKILKYFIRNNISVNKKSIKTELEDFIYAEANNVGSFFKDKTTNLYSDTIKKITLEQLLKSNEIVFEILENITTEDHQNYEIVVRELEGEFKRIHTQGIEKLEEIME